MSWEQQISNTAEFRGVVFHVDDHELSGGRRTQLHEYPGKDETYAEDLGLLARGFSLNAYVIGDDYIAQRDALIAALESPGPGTLKHPWLGTLKLSVTDYRMKESTRRGGMAEFTVQFVPGGKNEFPTGATDSRAAIEAAADDAVATCSESFAEGFSVDGEPAWSVDAVTERIDELAGDIKAGRQALVDVITKPKQLADQLTSAVGRLQAEVEFSLESIRQGADYGNAWAAVPLTNPTQITLANNQYQLKTLAQVSTTAEAVRQLSTTTLPSQAEAFEALEVINAAINQLQESTDPQGEPMDDRVEQSLTALRAAVNTDLRERGLKLPEVVTHTPDTTLPALVLAQQLYGDANRDEEIVARNRIAHPGFVPGGEPLEVLRDV